MKHRYLVSTAAADYLTNREPQEEMEEQLTNEDYRIFDLLLGKVYLLGEWFDLDVVD